MNTFCHSVFHVLHICAVDQTIFVVYIMCSMIHVSKIG